MVGGQAIVELKIPQDLAPGELGLRRHILAFPTISAAPSVRNLFL